METQQIQQYLVPGLIVAFFAFKFFRFRGIKAKLPDLLKQGAVLVDVRTTGEFSGMHNPISINIPLSEIQNKSKLKNLDPTKPIIVCCASGTRSAMAASVLKKNGFNNVLNAGPWQNTMTRA